jgi:hypothetical protein
MSSDVRNNKSNITIIIAFLIVFILLIANNVILLSNNPCTLSTQPSTPIKNDDSIYQVIVVANNENNADIYIRNKITRISNLFIEVNNFMEYGGNNIGEFHNEHLYILRNIGNTNSPTTNDQKELWRYDKHGQGEILFTGRISMFKVADNESNLVIVYTIENEDTDNIEKCHITISNGDGKKINDLECDKLTDKPDLFPNTFVWSTDGNTLWGTYTFGPVPGSFFKMLLPSSQFEIYSSENMNMGVENEINPNINKVIYSTYPPLFDVLSGNKFLANNTEVRLYLYDFATKERLLISSSNTKRFIPTWINDNVFAYNDPNSEKINYYIIE